MGARHRHRGKVLAGRGQGLSQRGPGLGVVALISPVVDIRFYFIPRGANCFQKLAALSEIWALNANVVVGAPYRAVAAVHSHQTQTEAHIGKIVNDILYHTLGSNPARASAAPHGTGVVQDDENIWFAGLCGRKWRIGAIIQCLRPCLVQAESSKYQGEAQENGKYQVFAFHYIHAMSLPYQRSCRQPRALLNERCRVQSPLNPPCS